MTVLQYGLSLTTGAFTGPMHAAQGTVRGFTNQLSNVGNMITGLANIPGAIKTLVEPMTKPITLAADVEVLGKSFKTLLGSGEAAAQMLKDVTYFAGSTPFQITEVAPAAKQLLAFGFAAKQVIPLMRDIGDMSALMDKPINEVADAFGRLKSGQFGEAFERMRAFGLSMKDLQGAGLVFDKSGSFVGSADQAIESVRQIIRRKFGGGMKEISSTFKGQFSNLTDAWEQMETKFGAPITKALTPIISELTAHITEWQPMAENFGKTLSTGISGAFNLFKSGELPGVLQNAISGMGKALLSNISVSMGAGISIAAAALKGAFQSAVALLSDGNFWEGIRGSVMSIADSLKSTLMSTAADLISMLPLTMRLGADVSGLRSGAEKAGWDAKMASTYAAEQFGLVDMDAVVSPLVSSIGKVGEIILDAGERMKANIENIPEFAKVGEALRNAAAGSKPMVPLAEQLRNASAGDMFQQGSSRREAVSGPDGITQRMVQILNPEMMEKLLNPNARQETGNGAALKKAIDEAGPLKRLLTVVEQMQQKIDRLGGGDGVYGY